MINSNACLNEIKERINNLENLFNIICLGYWENTIGNYVILEYYNSKEPNNPNGINNLKCEKYYNPQNVLIKTITYCWNVEGLLVKKIGS